MRSTRIAAEAIRDSVAQRRHAIGTFLLVAVLAAGLVALTSRERFDRNELISQLNSPTARTVVFTVSGGGAEIDPDAVNRVRQLSGVEFVLGFGPAVDVRNSNMLTGEPVALRTVVGQLSQVFPGTDSLVAESNAVAVRPAADKLGLVDEAGAVQNAAGTQWGVVATVEPVADFAWLDQTVLGRAQDDTKLQTLVVRASTASTLESSAAVARQILGVNDPALVRQELAADLLDASESIVRVADQQRQAVRVGALCLVTALNTVVLGTLVSSRRRDYGRRRALGASGSDVLLIVIVGFGTTSLAGAVGGVLVGSISAGLMGWPMPNPDIALAVLTATFASGLMSTVVPALIAARSSPLRELRQA